MELVVDFELFKKHVRADDFSDDDDLLKHYLLSAQYQVTKYTGRTLDELVELGDGDLPTDLAQAIFLVAGNSYNNREAVSATSQHAIPYGFEALVKPYAKLTT